MAETSSPRPALSVVVLCYKAGQGARPFVHRLKAAMDQAAPDWEMVLVGNYNAGDTADETPDVVRALAAEDPRLVAVVRPKEGYMGWDARSGLEAARGEVLGFIDGDAQMPPEDVTRAYRHLQDHDLDMVTTYRTKRDDGLIRLIQSRAYNCIFGLLFPGCPVRDVNSKPKLFRRDLYEKLTLTSNDWFLDTEIVIQVIRLGARVGEFPTVFHSSVERRSFVKLGAAWEFVVNLAQARLKAFLRR